MDSYRSNYLKTYLWKVIAIIVNFASFIVVVPYLSSNPQLYGIYTFCISFQLYLSYADIGFLSAGQKFAAEAFARNDREDETRIFGFVGAVLIVMILPFSALMIYLAYSPDVAINGVLEENKGIVSTLFIILAVVTPIQVVLQRLVQSILTIRVKDYVSARVDVVGSIIKILSVFYFFTGGRYLLTYYFLFINSVTIITSLIVIGIIRRTEHYDILALLKSIRFSKKYFDLMKKLAFTSLGATISWIICYELDLILIGKVFTVQEVSLYAVCFTLINYLRHLFNIIYGPYGQRFNHFIALNQEDNIKKMLINIVKYTFPICLFVCALMSSSSRYIILTWVGSNYEGSIVVLAILSWFYIFHFITQPANYVCIATKKYKTINFLSIASPIVFIGSFVIMHQIGVGYVSFAIAKLLMVLATLLIMGKELSNWINIWKTISNYLPLLIVMLVIVLVSNNLNQAVLPQPSKSTTQLITLFMLFAGYAVIYSIFVIVFDKHLRDKASNLIHNFIIR